MNPYEIEHLFTYRLQVAPPQIIGPVPRDVRLDFAIVGGEITGPCPQGSVRPGGADFGTLIEITYTGVMDLGSDDYGKFLKGEAPPAPLFAPPHVSARHIRPVRG
jgi:Protein of unknown function (DUF3237)